MMTQQQLIEKYPKIFKRYTGNPMGVNWSGVPDGWLPIVDKLCGSIQDYVDNTYDWINGEKEAKGQVRCTQMKEKFGGLRFYTDSGDDYVEGMIRMAEFLCENTCQDCGSEENIGKTRGWIYTICKSCADKRENTSWKSLEELKMKQDSSS
jgi:hypothetical protein